MMLKPSSSRIAYVKYALCTPFMVLLSYFLHQESINAQKVTLDQYGVKTTSFEKYNIRESIDTIVTFNPSTFAETVQIVKSTDTIYLKADKVAAFIEGQDSLMRFLAYNVKYPKEAREKTAEGRVLIEFTVNPYGWAEDVKLKRSAGNDFLDNEALRVVSILAPQMITNKTRPYWTAGMYQGKNVSTYVVLPISFKLEKDKK